MARDPYRFFRIEAAELLELLVGEVARLRAADAAAGAEAVRRMLRAAHTLKGAAGVVGAHGIARHAHGLEDRLVPYREGERLPGEAELEELLAEIDAISAGLSALGAPAATPSQGGPGGARAAGGGPSAPGESAGGASPKAPGADPSPPGASPSARGPSASDPDARGTGASDPGARGAGASDPGARGSGASDPGARGTGASDPSARGSGASGPRTSEPSAGADAATGERQARPSAGAAGPVAPLGGEGAAPAGGEGAAPAAAEGAAPAAAEGAAPPALDTVRVSVDELDELLAELAEARARASGLGALTAELAQARRDLGRVVNRLPERRQQREARAVNRLLRGLGQRLEASLERLELGLERAAGRAGELRTLPARALFSELERAARETARAAAREVSLVTEGGETGVDVRVLSEVRAALLQLVRNAVAHGVEDPAARARAGKPARGRIELRVRAQGDQVAFLVRDDGRGADLDALRRAAVSAGLLDAEAAAGLSREETLALAFRPGLSTAASTTLTSGRGVGLDVVRDVALRLRGHVAARCAPGEGLEVELLVPVTLSSVRTLAVSAAERQLALPLGAVRAVRQVQLPADGLDWGGAQVPLATLARLLDGQQGALRGGPAAVVVIEAPAGVVALAVERVGAVERELLVPLPPLCGDLPLVCGAVLDPQGTPRLVLDPDGLVAAVLGGGEAPAATAAPARPAVLVVDDSLTTRMLEQTILEAHGYEVGLAGSAEEALVRARERRWGLLLVDVEMPGMNGFELLERLKADPELREIPAVMLTTLGSEEHRRRGLKAGAAAYLIKSEFDERELLRVVRGFVG
ncbi:MAG: response regulator [Planctomycetota bacterium]